MLLFFYLSFGSIPSSLYLSWFPMRCSLLTVRVESLNEIFVCVIDTLIAVEIAGGSSIVAVAQMYT